MLEADTEAALVARWREAGDEKALERLVASYQRLVTKMANRYRGYGLPIADLISEGNVGLMQALQRFDPEKGFRLSTYATWWIRAAITDYVLGSASMVKAVTTERHRRLFFNLRRMKERLGEGGNRELSPEATTTIASVLDASEADVRDIDQWLGTRHWSINSTIHGEDGETRQWQDRLVDPAPDQESTLIELDETAKRKALVTDMLDTLDSRERHILSERHLCETPRKLAELGNHYGITRERVRQIEARAIRKLQKKVRTAASAEDLLAAAHAHAGDRRRILVERSAKRPIMGGGARS